MQRYYVHETAEVSSEAIVGERTKIWNQAQIRENAELGDDCIIGKNVYIDEGVKIGNRVKVQNNVNIYNGVIIEDDVFCGPNMTFTNDLYPRAFNNNWKIVKTKVKKGASIGANATIKCGITIGEYATIGAGSVVVKNVLPHALMIGNPARAVGWVCKCGYKLDGVGTCIECGEKYDIKQLERFEL